MSILCCLCIYSPLISLEIFDFTFPLDSCKTLHYQTTLKVENSRKISNQSNTRKCLPEAGRHRYVTMGAPPFQFNLSQIETLRTQRAFTMIRAKTYMLPSPHLSILSNLPKAEHLCHSCDTSYIYQLAGDPHPEKPMVLPCGHLCGSRCLEIQLDTMTPRCPVCNRRFPLHPRHKVGAHGPAVGEVGGLSQDRNPALSQQVERESHNMSGISRSTTRAGSLARQSTQKDGTRGMSILDILNPAEDNGATSGHSKLRESAMPCTKATMEELTVQSFAVNEGGETAEDVDAANILVQMSADSGRYNI